MTGLKVLDCTLRDGGFALEDAAKNGIKTEFFEEEDRKNIAHHIVDSYADIIEIGAIEQTVESKRGFGIYQNIEEISAVIPKKTDTNQLFAGFYRGPDIDSALIPEWKEGMLDCPRVCLRYSELVKSLKFAKDLSDKGYKVFLQPMVTVRYSEDELKLVLEYANKMNAYAVYFVDSYGYMKFEDIHRYFDLFDGLLNRNINIGFHSHNNMGMALMNVIEFINIDTNRGRIIDSCATGMGQGTGNLCSEIIMNYLNVEKGCNYNIHEMYKACEIVDRFNVNKLWGYSVPRFISAQNKTAYKYAMALKDKYQFSYSEIDDILGNIPEDLRFRYTVDNTVELLNRLGYK